MKPLLAVSAVLAVLIGIGLSLATKAFMAPMGIEVTDQFATMAQAQGVLLIALGVINWLSRRVSDWRGLRAVLAGNLVAQVGSMTVNVRAILLGLVTSQAWGAVAMHALLGIGFAYFLVRGGNKAAN